MTVLPGKAKIYFDSLWGARSADSWVSLSARQQDFELEEFARRGGPNGSGYAARLSAIYQEALLERAREIARTLIEVHQAFESPLQAGVDQQLQEWGTSALVTARDALAGAYARHLSRFGLRSIQPLDLGHAFVRGQTTVFNLPARHLWAQRNVPAKHPQTQSARAPVTINHITNNIANSGTIHVLQTGDRAIAYGNQQWIEGDTSALQTALGELRKALQRSQEAAADVREKQLADIANAVAELQHERPSKSKLLGLLSTIGTAVAVIADAQSAYEAVKSAAALLGIPIP